jgi:hypothetical protein
MNEQIKTIWNQAAASYEKADTSWQTQQNFLNRFAELIIAECAGIAAGSDMPSKDIKDHFGIKK